MEPQDVVQAAIGAYYAHDLDRCLSFYAPDVVVKRADGTIVMEGAEAERASAIREVDVRPSELHYDIPNRITLGPFVIDEERVTAIPPEDPMWCPRRWSTGSTAP